MVENGRIALKYAALFRVHHMLLERNEPVAPADHEYFIEQLEEIVEFRLARALALEPREGLVQEFLQDVSRRRDDHDAEGNPQDNDKLRQVEQQDRLPACEHEPAQGGRHDDDTSDDDQHKITGDKAGMPAGAISARAP